MIRFARHDRVWTIGELADRAGVSEHTVRAVENGEATPSIGNVFNVAVAAGVLEPLCGSGSESWALPGLSPVLGPKLRSAGWKDWNRDTVGH
ncbi:MAG: helix-turn-helix domain-containing protein [Actinobacteria bacterium]|nr:helix-turn-helix domain-containing protein [Actinomycetota bacterium]